MKILEKMKTLKDKIFIVVIVIVVAAGAVSLFTSDLEHIEDTNGPDNYALQTITDADIIRCEMGCLNLRESEGLLSDTITYSSHKFTGVTELYRSDSVSVPATPSCLRSCCRWNSSTAYSVLLPK